MNGSFFDDLIHWIDTHIENRLNLDMVADRAGYSKWHLQRMFKEHTGHALGEYIRNQKIRKIGLPVKRILMNLSYRSRFQWASIPSNSFNRSF